MKRLAQLLVVIASTASGAAVGRYVLVPLAVRLMPYLSWLLARPGPPKHDLGDLVGGLFVTGYNIGLLSGISMTAAVLCGLFAGLALAGRVPPLVPQLKPNAA